MVVMPSGWRIGQLLEEEGLIPPECGTITLIIPPDGVMILKCEIVVDAQFLGALAKVLAEHAQNVQAANMPTKTP